jgi:hypothetical protein
MGLDMLFFVELPHADSKNGPSALELSRKFAIPPDFFLQEPNERGFVEYGIGYLRKVNAVHGWIIREVANGVDDCKDIILTRKTLKKLLRDCRKALARRAKDEVPTSPESLHLKEFAGVGEFKQHVIEEARQTSVLTELEKSFKSTDPLRPTVGFFFGTYEKDASYYEGLEQTKELVEMMLSLPKDFRFFYLADW